MGSVISDIECPNCNKKLAPQYFKQHKAKCDLVKGEIKKTENTNVKFNKIMPLSASVGRYAQRVLTPAQANKRKRKTNGGDTWKEIFFIPP